MGRRDTANGVRIELTHAEALTLFDWLAREDNEGKLPFEDHAEELVLWRIEGQLEKTLGEVFAPDYKEAIDAARQEVREYEA